MKRKILDVGCGAMPYKFLFTQRGWQYLGMDIENAGADFDYQVENVLRYDGHTFPLPDGKMDMVFHSEVLEHVYDTAHFLPEYNRVLRPGGTLLFTVPFQARYHYIPNDYWRFTPSAMQALLKTAGFQDISIFPRGNDLCVAAYKVLTVGYRLFFSKSWWRMLISMILAPVWILSLLLGQLFLHSGFGSQDDCLGYVVRCEKPFPAEGI